MTATYQPSDRHSPHQLRSMIEDLVRQNQELEKFNQALTTERRALANKLDEASRMLRATTTGLIVLDKSGLIDTTNDRAAQMLGTDHAYMSRKPISMFIAPEDQAVFYLNRSRIVAGTSEAPFEIKLKHTDGTLRSARVHAYPVASPQQHLPGLLLVIEDITRYRQAMESLQFKEYVINLLFSIIDDLSVWSSADIDEIITYALEKVGLVSGADRVYTCLFHGGNTRFSVTHEWCGNEIESPIASLQAAKVADFSRVLRLLSNRSTTVVEDMNALNKTGRPIHDRFHATGVRSFLFAPLVHGNSLLGIIGCDAVRRQLAWPRETQSLVQCVGHTIVNALLRRQLAAAPETVHNDLLEFVPPSPEADSDDLLEYDGPIEIMDTCKGSLDWCFEPGEPEDTDIVNTALLMNGKTAHIACKHCNQHKLLDIDEIRDLGTRLKATCTCGKEQFVKIELRREQRKAVNLDGVLIRGHGNRIALKSDDWARIKVNNLSRSGIGFKLFASQDVRVDDRFRVKFTLDNTASSVIQKDVVVRSVTPENVGCMFVGQASCDVTIGFYMMT